MDNDGLWQASQQVHSKRQTAYGKTRQEAAERSRVLQGVARESGRSSGADRVTVSEYLARWLHQAEARLRHETLNDYRRIARLHMGPHISTLRLSRLNPLHFSRLYSTLAWRE